MVSLGLANAVNGRDGGHDHHIAPLQHALGARQAHLFNVLVDGRVFLNEQVALGHIGLRLVVVVVADKIFHRVLRKKLAKLTVELRRQRFIGRKHNGRSPQAGNHIGHGEGFSRASHTQQGLKDLPIRHAFHQFVDRLGLVASRRIRLVQLKGRIGKAQKLARERQVGSIGLCKRGKG